MFKVNFITLRSPTRALATYNVQGFKVLFFIDIFVKINPVVSYFVESIFSKKYTTSCFVESCFLKITIRSFNSMRYLSYLT